LDSGGTLDEDAEGLATPLEELIELDADIAEEEALEELEDGLGVVDVVVGVGTTRVVVGGGGGVYAGFVGGGGGAGGAGAGAASASSQSP